MPSARYLATFDTETTGPDPETDAIVTAFIGLYDSLADARHEDPWAEQYDWLLEPRIPIADGAAAVHGISQDFAAEWGTDARLGVFEISQRLDIFQRQGIPLVAFNARFDFTLLDREYRRYFPGGRPFAPALVLDPFVIDKALSPYRKGKRTLTAVCAHLGVPVAANAHDAGADCLMAARLASYMISESTSLAPMTLERIHEREIEHAESQGKGLAAYFRKAGRTAEAATVQTEWPVVQYREKEMA